MTYISNIRTITPENLKNNTEKKVFEMLNNIHIPYSCVTNDAVDTMEECEDINKVLDVEIRKSIFLCNKKKTSFFLIVLPANKSLDVTSLEKKIGVSKLSFAPSESMYELLGAYPGSASVMGLINDKEDYVQLIIDKEVAEEKYFGCNAGINTTHLKIETKYLLNIILPKIHHKAKIISL